MNESERQEKIKSLLRDRVYYLERIKKEIPDYNYYRIALVAIEAKLKEFSTELEVQELIK